MRSLNFSSTSRSADSRGTQTQVHCMQSQDYCTSPSHTWNCSLQFKIYCIKQQNKQVNNGFKFLKQQRWRSSLFCITYRWLYCHTMAKCSNWHDFQSQKVLPLLYNTGFAQCKGNLCLVYLEYIDIKVLQFVLDVFTLFWRLCSILVAACKKNINTKIL